jgi:hypothetical protein
MQQLALFNWGPLLVGIPEEPRPAKRDEWDGPFLPRIAFVARLSDSLIDTPRGVPEVVNLSREPYIDAETGDEVGDQPARGFFIRNSEADNFQRFMQKTSDLLATLERYRDHWRFIDTALGFLLKAFTTDGLEQLLWHITAIEAVLGQKGPGLTERLLRRVSNVLGSTPKERKEFRNRFNNLYEYRSGLVHGRADLAEKEIYLGHLGEARDFARSIVLWMLNYSALVVEKLPKEGTGAPTREDLLHLLDLEHGERQHMMTLLGTVSDEFPSITEWL